MTLAHLIYTKPTPHHPPPRRLRTHQPAIQPTCSVTVRAVAHLLRRAGRKARKR